MHHLVVGAHAYDGGVDTMLGIGITPALAAPVGSKTSSLSASVQYRTATRFVSVAASTPFTARNPVGARVEMLGIATGSGACSEAW